MTPNTKIYDPEFYLIKRVYLLKGKSLFVEVAGNRPKSVHAKPTPLAVTKHSSYVESRGFILHSRSK